MNFLLFHLLLQGPIYLLLLTILTWWKLSATHEILPCYNTEPHISTNVDSYDVLKYNVSTGPENSQYRFDIQPKTDFTGVFLEVETYNNGIYIIEWLNVNKCILAFDYHPLAYYEMHLYLNVSRDFLHLYANGGWCTINCKLPRFQANDVKNSTLFARGAANWIVDNYNFKICNKVARYFNSQCIVPDTETCKITHFNSKEDRNGWIPPLTPRSEKKIPEWTIKDHMNPTADDEDDIGLPEDDYLPASTTFYINNPSDVIDFTGSGIENLPQYIQDEIYKQTYAKIAEYEKAHPGEKIYVESITFDDTNEQSFDDELKLSTLEIERREGIKQSSEKNGLKKKLP